MTVSWSCEVAGCNLPLQKPALVGASGLDKRTPVCQPVELTKPSSDLNVADDGSKAGQTLLSSRAQAFRLGESAKSLVHSHASAAVKDCFFSAPLQCIAVTSG